MATSLNYSPFDANMNPADRAIGMQWITNTYVPSVSAIDFQDQALCESAAQKLKDASHFGTQSALCLQRN